MFYWIALAAASAVAFAAVDPIACAQQANATLSCVQNARQSSSSGGSNPGSACCANYTTPLLQQCGGYESLYQNSFYLGAQGQALVQSVAGTCPASNISACQSVATSFATCVAQLALGNTLLYFNVTATGGNFSLNFKPATSTQILSTAALPLSATAASVLAAVQSLSPTMAVFATAATRTPTTWGFELKITVMANFSTEFIGSLNGTYLVPSLPSPAVIVPTRTLVLPPLSANNVTTASVGSCCSYHAQFDTVCASYNLQNATGAGYVFPFAIDPSTYLGSFGLAVHTVCPIESQNMCSIAINQTLNCMSFNGYLYNASLYNPSSCCNWANFANRSCANYPDMTGPIVPTAALSLYQRQIADCSSSNNGNSNGNSSSNACSAAVSPSIFVWAVNGTMAPVINFCNSTNPTDPNFGKPCTVVTTVNGKPYYLYTPMANATGTYTYNPQCTGV